MIRYLITDGTSSNDSARWLDHLAFWLREGVDVIQIRERDLSARDLAALTRRVLALPERGTTTITTKITTKILVNDRADVAIACGADGVHLRDGSVNPGKFRRPDLLISASCHNPEDAARFAEADYVLLAPIFNPLSKTGTGQALGTEAIREFTRRSSVPVLALGGITDQTAAACLEAGAAGLAGITFYTR